MKYTSSYMSPLGTMLYEFDDVALYRLWFSGQKYGMDQPLSAIVPYGHAIATQVQDWLDCYFGGGCPDFTPPLLFQGTEFQRSVWQMLIQIPYGETVTYGAIAKAIAKQRGCIRMSAQAVGGAVGHNPIGIIVPCHRVVGKNGNLTGYAAGLDKKLKLLRLEQVDVSKLFHPSGCTAF